MGYYVKHPRCPGKVTTPLSIICSSRCLILTVASRSANSIRQLRDESYARRSTREAQAAAAFAPKSKPVDSRA